MIEHPRFTTVLLENKTKDTTSIVQLTFSKWQTFLYSLLVQFIIFCKFEVQEAKENPQEILGYNNNLVFKF